MSSQSYEDLVRRIFHPGTTERVPRQVLDEIYAPGFICHAPPAFNHTHANGNEPVEICLFQDALADVVFDITGIAVEDDRVVTRFVARGRQVAEFNGVPGHGEERIVRGLAIHRVADGRLAEGWGEFRIE